MLAVLLLNRMSAMSARRRMSRREKPVKVDKTVRQVASDVYCRTCLSKEELMPIFYGKHTDEKRSHDLKLVTGVQINKNDGLSQKICSQCLDIINQGLQFRKTSRKTEKALLNMVSGVKPKKKYSSSLHKNVSKRTKVKKPEVKKKEEEDDIDCDYSYDMYDDSFQGNEDYKDVLVKEEKPKIQQKLTHVKKKRLTIPTATSYKCNTCNKEFRMKATYKAHIRFHTNYCVCESCGKRCRNNNQLQEHKRARHGLGRIHKCAYCEYSSATKEALTIHERRHTGERPYVCDHCGATFHRRSNLVQHIAIHLPEKNFQCDMCPKRLKSRKFLQIHKHNAHTGKRYGYLCPVCDHRFEKPNKCTICNKCEKSKKRLQIHVYKNHRSRQRYRYACPVCADTFSRADNVRQHLARTHAVPRHTQPHIHKIQIQVPTMPEDLPPAATLAATYNQLPRGP